MERLFVISCVLVCLSLSAEDANMRLLVHDQLDDGSISSTVKSLSNELDSLQNLLNVQIIQVQQTIKQISHQLDEKQSVVHTQQNPIQNANGNDVNSLKNQLHEMQQKMKQISDQLNGATVQNVKPAIKHDQNQNDMINQTISNILPISDLSTTGYNAFQDIMKQMTDANPDLVQLFQNDGAQKQTQYPNHPSGFDDTSYNEISQTSPLQAQMVNEPQVPQNMLSLPTEPIAQDTSSIQHSVPFAKMNNNDNG